MKAATKERREAEKRDGEERQALLENPAFHQFLRHLHSNAGRALAHQASSWLPGWILTGCELYFTDIDERIERILAGIDIGV